MARGKVTGGELRVNWVDLWTGTVRSRNTGDWHVYFSKGNTRVAWKSEALHVASLVFVSSQTGPKGRHWFCWRQTKVFPLFSKERILLFCFILPRDSSATQKHDRDDASPQGLSQRLGWYPYCLMRTGQSETNWCLKSHTRHCLCPLDTSARWPHQGLSVLKDWDLSFVICRLMIEWFYRGESPWWETERQRTAAVPALRQFFQFSSWCNVLGNYTSYYHISEGYWTHHVPVDFHVGQHYDNFKINECCSASHVIYWHSYWLTSSCFAMVKLDFGRKCLLRQDWALLLMKLLSPTISASLVIKE